MVENIVGKGEKCWLPVFSPFPKMFSKGLFPTVVKSQDCMVKVNALPNEKILMFLLTTNVASLMISIFDTVEIVGEGESTRFQHFLFFPL